MPNPIYSEKREYTEIDEKTGSEEHIAEDLAAERENTIAKITGIIWLALGILEGIIGFRVLLKLLAANPNNAFANFIYDISYPFLAGFFGLFGTPSSDGNILEVTSLVAMLVYLFIVWAVVTLIKIIMSPYRVRHVKTTHRR